VVETAKSACFFEGVCVFSGGDDAEGVRFAPYALAEGAERSLHPAVALGAVRHALFDGGDEGGELIELLLRPRKKLTSESLRRPASDPWKFFEACD
jgi:hypothetical protein